MGRKNTIDIFLSFLFRYVWAICAMILLCEFVFMVHTAYVSLQQASRSVSDASRRELEHKLSVTWKLGYALTQDLNLSNTAISLEDRALLLKPYNTVYELFLIGITDTAGKITSTYDDIPGDIGYRDYFKRVVATGKAEITDVFAAGADNTTKNYTICLPYNDSTGKVAGTILMSIPFKGVNDMITRILPGADYLFTLLGSDNTIMADRDTDLLDKPFKSLVNNSPWSSQDTEEIIRKVEAGQAGSYWALDNWRLLLVQYYPIKPTNWKLLTAVDAISSSKPIFYAFLIKGLLYLCLFGGISFFGKMYTEGKLKDLNVLIRQIVDLQNELHDKKLLSSDEFGELAAVSQKGLIDDLTGLPTRTVFLRQIKTSLDMADINQHAALVVIDLDGLKQLNDTYGHEAGDTALHDVGETLLIIAEEYGAFVSRFGGDEFLIYLPIPDTHSLPTRLERLRSTLCRSFNFAGSLLETHVSIGAAIHPLDGMDFETLYRKADNALYKSKKEGKNRYSIWNDAIQLVTPS